MHGLSHIGGTGPYRSPIRQLTLESESGDMFRIADSRYIPVVITELRLRKCTYRGSQRVCGAAFEIDKGAIEDRQLLNVIVVDDRGGNLRFADCKRARFVDCEYIYAVQHLQSLRIPDKDTVAGGATYTDHNRGRCGKA